MTPFSRRTLRTFAATMNAPDTSRRRRRDGTRRNEGAGGREEDQQRRRQPRILGKSRTRTRRGGRGISFAVMAAAAGFALGAGTGGVDAQWTDGGAVAMSCGLCECSGSSDDGTLYVFDNPSTGDRVSRLSDLLLLASHNLWPFLLYVYSYIIPHLVGQ